VKPLHTFLFLLAGTLLCSSFSIEKEEPQLHVYCIPGQGADYRLFQDIEWPQNTIVHNVHYTLPEDGATMASYAKQLSNQIDTTQRYAIVGTSLGGMLATEMADILNPEKIVIISSAKSKYELPKRYSMQQKLPLNRLFSGTALKMGALIMQPIVEPDRNVQKEVFVAMLKAKDPVFMKRSVNMIIQWKRTTYSENIVHIHGAKDNTIPIRNVHCDYTVADGSHMMTLTMAKEMSALLAPLLTDQN